MILKYVWNNHMQWSHAVLDSKLGSVYRNFRNMLIHRHNVCLVYWFWQISCKRRFWYLDNHFDSGAFTSLWTWVLCMEHTICMKITNTVFIIRIHSHKAKVCDTTRWANKFLPTENVPLSGCKWQGSVYTNHSFPFSPTFCKFGGNTT